MKTKSTRKKVGKGEDKRDRDRYSGQYLPKDDEPRKVRSMRLTDSAWEQLGKRIEGTKISRADLIEHFAKDQIDVFMDLYSKYYPQPDTPTITITKEELESMMDKALRQLKVGKQASLYKSANKGFQKLLAIAFPD